MSRPSLSVVALVLALSAVAVAGATTAPVASPSPGEPNHLAINESAVAASNTTTVDLDVGTAVAADSAALQANYTAMQFTRAYENAETAANRSRIRERALERIGNATEVLRERDRAAIDAYASGETSAGAFLRERARITTRADELRSVVDAVRSTLPYRPSSDVSARLNEIDGRLEVLAGPISESTATGVVQGGAGPAVYVEVSEADYTLARVTDGAYVRETFLGSAWRPEADNQFAAGDENPLAAAKARAVELYPWVSTNKLGGGGTFGVGGSYRISWVLPGDGELTIYLSGGTTDVFREAQRRPLATFNTSTAIDRTNESLRLTVNRTYETGPAKVTLRDASGAPVDGTVVVGDRAPVPVGADGTVWIVEPRGDVRINATADSARVSATL